ncbi:DUF1877 family protein [Peterkaempfera sp. SMS 1(5)a]|uniref:DUF1877 family protein n=1 Tax=Peterkaempfera podocarpi TaxID=3232308 RepID=UPI00366A944C
MDFYWRRVAVSVLDEASPKQLDALVLRWFDPQFGPLQEAGVVLGVSTNHCLMHGVLTWGDAGDVEVAELPVFGGELRTEGEEHPEYGFIGVEVVVLTPDQVRQAAGFLRAVPVRQRVRDLDAVMPGVVADWLFSTPWSEKWADELVTDLLELVDFFTAAADTGDAILKVQSA